MKKLFKFFASIFFCFFTLCFMFFVITCFGFIFFFFSPDPISDAARIGAGANINSYFMQMEKRQKSNSNTYTDHLVLNTTYKSMIFVSSFIYPEASLNLNHYLYGDGTDLELPNNYLRNSPVVRRAIRNSNYGVNGPFSLKQREDYRLSYTYNPFSLKITKINGKRKIRIYQKMIFSKRSGVRTTFKLGLFKFKMSDSLVYVVGNCKPFVAYAEWYE